MRAAFAGYWKRTSAILLLALALRLFFALACPHIGGDSPIYEAFARNLLNSGTYSHLEPQNHSAPRPTLIRVPGYPLMIAAVFAAAGEGNETAIRLLQAFLDVWTCVLIALIAFEIAGGPDQRRRRIAQWALLLSALCPFTANYSASILAEVPTTLLWSAATLFGLRALQQRGTRRNWFYCGLLAGAATMFRPESGMLAGIFLVILIIKQMPRPAWKPVVARAGLLGAGIVMALLPWTARNALTLHTFQSLAPTYAQDVDETVTSGYFNWCRTWLWTYRDVALYLFPLETEPLTVALPSGSYDGDSQGQEILRMIRRHNEQGNYLEPESDAAFEKIARQLRSRHPLRCYLGLPALRSLAMWFTPRVELLEFEGKLLPVRKSWEDDRTDFSVTLFLFLLNCIYISLGAFGALSILRRTRSFKDVEFLGCFTLLAIILVRTAILAFFFFPEPRYVLETYPAVIALAAFAFQN